MDRILKNSRRPDITFCRNGRILISARVADALGIAPGDSINIAFLQGECLLFGVTGNAPFGRRIAQCQPTKKGCRHLFANSVELCRAVLAATDPYASRISLAAGPPMALDGVKCIPLITHNPL